jgi:hypothetical protein
LHLLTSTRREFESGKIARKCIFVNDYMAIMAIKAPVADEILPALAAERSSTMSATRYIRCWYCGPGRRAAAHSVRSINTRPGGGVMRLNRGDGGLYALPFRPGGGSGGLRRRVSHGGGCAGYNCDLRLLPDHGSGVMAQARLSAMRLKPQ